MPGWSSDITSSAYACWNRVFMVRASPTFRANVSKPRLTRIRVDDLVGHGLQAEAIDVDHEVVQMRVVDVAVEEPLDELPAAAVHAVDEPPGRSRAESVPPHDLLDAVRSRGDDPHRETLRPRQQKLGPASDEHGVAPACRRQHDPPQLNDVF